VGIFAARYNDGIPIQKLIALKKIQYIILLFIYLLANTEIRQVTGISALYKHFHQHQKQDTSLSFLTFLKMHYLEDDGNPYDNDEDAKLPFKHPHSCCLIYSATPVNKVSIKMPFTPGPDKSVFYYSLKLVPAITADEMLRPPINFFS
jgi:hypothetical protein